MPTFNEDIFERVRNNPNFCQELATNEHSQLVLMSIEPGNDIGEQVHDVDEVLIIVEGTGEAVLNRKHSLVLPDSLIFVPAGTRHNCINTSSTPLKLFSILAPPEYAPGTFYRTKAESVEAEK